MDIEALVQTDTDQHVQTALQDAIIRATNVLWRALGDNPERLDWDHAHWELAWSVKDLRHVLEAVLREMGDPLPDWLTFHVEARVVAGYGQDYDEGELMWVDASQCLGCVAWESGVRTVQPLWRLRHPGSLI